jgi:hypothetical protein
VRGCESDPDGGSGQSSKRDLLHAALERFTRIITPPQQQEFPALFENYVVATHGSMTVRKLARSGR